MEGIAVLQDRSLFPFCRSKNSVLTGTPVSGASTEVAKRGTGRKRGGRGGRQKPSPMVIDKPSLYAASLATQLSTPDVPSLATVDEDDDCSIVDAEESQSFLA